jgi:DNA polymerase-1
LADGKVFVSADKELFKSLLRNPELKKYTRGSKPLFAYADKNGFEIESLEFDTELAAYLLNPSEKDYSDEHLCMIYDVALPVTDNEA